MINLYLNTKSDFYNTYQLFDFRNNLWEYYTLFDFKNNLWEYYTEELWEWDELHTFLEVSQKEKFELVMELI